jgi:hypothetical protein
MCNFNKLPDDSKAFLHLFMSKAALSIGGANYLLALIEAMRSKKPHPLCEKNSQVASNKTIIKWAALPLLNSFPMFLKPRRIADLSRESLLCSFLVEAMH